MSSSDDEEITNNNDNNPDSESIKLKEPTTNDPVDEEKLSDDDFYSDEEYPVLEDDQELDELDEPEDLNNEEDPEKDKDLSLLKPKIENSGINLSIDDDFNLGVDSSIYISPPSSDVEEEYDDYLQKFDSELRNNFINEYHSEVITNNYSEINSLINKSHKTIPFLTKYERTRVLGLRTKQINLGSKSYVEFKSNIIDGYLIAELELKAKKIPYIVRRPIPDNTSEYWKLSDLELL